MSTFTICATIDISGILLIFSKVREEINMDSESKIIIEVIRSLLKDYRKLTNGEVPNDWVNVRDERASDVARLEREIKKLDGNIDDAIAFNKEIEKNAMPSLKAFKPGMYEQLEDEVKENEEKIESYRKESIDIKVELAQAQYELEQANEQIETRRQAGIEKVKQEIHDRIKQNIEDREGIEEDQEKLEALRKYENISEEEIQNLAAIVEKQEKDRLKTSKIEAMKLALERKEKTHKDLLTEDYYRAKEVRLQEIEEAGIEEIEQMKSITITSIYKKVLQQALQENNTNKVEMVFNRMTQVVEREESINQKELSSKKEGVQAQEESTFSGIGLNSKPMQEPKKVGIFAKMKETISKWISNRVNKVKLLVAGNEEVLISEEELHERWKREQERRQQQIQEIARQREEEKERQFSKEETIYENVPDRDLQGRVVLSREEEIEKQLKEARESGKAKFMHDIDYVNEMRKRAGEVKIITNEEQERKYEAYRKARGIDKAAVEAKQEIQETQVSPMEQREIKISRIPDVIKTSQVETLKEKQRKTIKGFFVKQRNRDKSEQMQEGNLYKQGLNAGISQIEQRKRARAFQENIDKNGGDKPIEEIAFEG